MTHFFAWLYELFCGPNEEIPEFRDTIFGTVGLSSLLLAATAAVLFYLVLGRFWHVWHTRVHWACTLAGCLLGGFAIAFGVSRQVLGLYNGYVLLFGLMNGVWLMTCFILLSILLKRFSIYAKRTPF